MEGRTILHREVAEHPLQRTRIHVTKENLPYGVFRPSAGEVARPGVAIGDYVLDLSAICRAGIFNGPLLKGTDCFLQSSLNSFMAMGRPTWKEARATIQKLLSVDEPTLRDNAELRRKALFRMSQVQMVLPAVIGDYTDFFSSKYHTQNCIAMLYGPEAPVPPNWLNLPVAYHGRASSVVISGTDIVRPRGQMHPAGKPSPGFGPSAKLDFELEMAAIVGPGNELGQAVDVNDATDHVFGLVLMNDWSARDIQAWESLPLGPFLGKSFGTTISPWIITLEALEPFSCEAHVQEPPPLPYLAGKRSHSFDIPLEVAINPAGEDKAYVVCTSNFNHLNDGFDRGKRVGRLKKKWKDIYVQSEKVIGLTDLKQREFFTCKGMRFPTEGTFSALQTCHLSQVLIYLYWTIEQQIAHHTINGCNLRSGDLLGSGTISGPKPENVGCLLELTCDGKKQLKVGNNLNRTFLEDGDEVILTACCQGDGFKVGFGACCGKILPAIP